jgi:uncharacterized protein YndB with AHSA1/START domain
MLRLIPWIVGALLLIVGGIALAGSRLPVGHIARVERDFPITPRALWAIIATPAELPKWRRGLTRIEMVDAPAGTTRYREVSGRDAILYEVVESRPAVAYLTRIADRDLPFGGTWRWELQPTEGGVHLRITEEGEVYNPIFRFVARYVMGHSATLEAYMADLAAEVARRHGTPADPPR